MLFSLAKKRAIRKWKRMVNRPLDYALGSGECAFCEANNGGRLCDRYTCPLAERKRGCAHEFVRWNHFAFMKNKNKARYWAKKLLTRIEKSRKPINWPRE